MWHSEHSLDDLKAVLSLTLLSRLFCTPRMVVFCVTLGVSLMKPKHSKIICYLCLVPIFLSYFRLQLQANTAWRCFPFIKSHALCKLMPTRNAVYSKKKKTLSVSSTLCLPFVDWLNAQTDACVLALFRWMISILARERRGITTLCVYVCARAFLYLLHPECQNTISTFLKHFCKVRTDWLVLTTSKTWLRMKT